MKHDDVKKRIKKLDISAEIFELLGCLTGFAESQLDKGETGPAIHTAEARDLINQVHGNQINYS